MLAITIDTKALLDSVLVGLLGALALTLAFSVGALALDRAQGANRPYGANDGKAGAGAIAWWALTVLAGTICIGIIVLGVWAMAQKS